MAMFKKTVDEDGLYTRSDDDDWPNIDPTPRVDTMSPVRFQNVSIIGPTLVIKGELSADEDLVIEGHIEGTIAHHKKHLTVGEQGRVKGDIHAHSVIILGQLLGDIHSEGMVSLAKGADVNGNITCARIAVEDGARWKGRIDMHQEKATSKVIAVPKETAQPGSVHAEKESRSDSAKLN